MRRVRRPNDLSSARFLLWKRKIQRWLPRRSGGLATIVVFVIALAVALLAGIDKLDQGSRLTSLALAGSAALGLNLQDVEVNGRRATPVGDVLTAVDATRGQPILSISLPVVRERLEALPWVRAATVERRLPGTIFVQLVERRPLALWQHDHRMVLVDTEGNVITDRNLGRYADLLLVVGADAPMHAQPLLDLMATEPELRKRVVSAVRVGGRRWNLQLDNGMTVELPESGTAEAWGRLAEIERDHALLARDILTIDLRLRDRVVVRPAADAMKPAAPAGKSGKPGTKAT